MGYLAVRFEGGSERTITIGGWSKGWAMTGWRLSWIAGLGNVMDGVKAVNVSSANALLRPSPCPPPPKRSP